MLVFEKKSFLSVRKDRRQPTFDLVYQWGTPDSTTALSNRDQQVPPDQQKVWDSPFASREGSKSRTYASLPIPLSVFDVWGSFLCSLVSIISFSRLCKPRAIISCLSEFGFLAVIRLFSLCCMFSLCMHPSKELTVNYPINFLKWRCTFNRIRAQRASYSWLDSSWKCQS